MQADRETGVVVRWNDEKGFGFLRSDRTKRQLFAHHTEITNIEGYRTLVTGQRVTFASVPDDAGRLPKAIDIHIEEVN